MLNHTKDEVRTAELRKMKVFVDRDSYVSMDGHMYLRGEDRSALRERVRTDMNAICCVCHERAWSDGDLEHIVGGLGPQRCDCYNTKLANGTRHTNVAWIHGMFSHKPCHRNKHNREPQLKWIK